MSWISNYILFDFAHSDHCVVKHLFHEDSLLRVNHLVVSFFEFAISLKISNVKSRIVLEPFEIRLFIGDTFLVFVLIEGCIFFIDTFQKIRNGFLPTLVVVARAHSSNSISKIFLNLIYNFLFFICADLYHFKMKPFHYFSFK